jgi:predicted RNA-binding protein with PUA-like domain
MPARHWLFKSDPEVFGLAELERSPGRRTGWDGIRNYQARNLLRDEVQVGDGVLFYHSQSRPPAIVAVARVVKAAYPDPTQFDPSAPGHDPDSRRGAPRWLAVDIRLEKKLPRAVGLPELRGTPGLAKMVLLHRSRLSVQPVTATEWRIILKLAGLAAT